nr:DUF2189 domain-containing protein [Mesorhizobium sp.]
MIVAPFLALGLYEKSRAIEEGRAIGLASMLLVRPTGGAQVFFTGLLLCLLLLLWTRAAVLLWLSCVGRRLRDCWPLQLHSDADGVSLSLGAGRCCA